MYGISWSTEASQREGWPSRVRSGIEMLPFGKQLSSRAMPDGTATRKGAGHLLSWMQKGVTSPLPLLPTYTTCSAQTSNLHGIAPHAPPHAHIRSSPHRIPSLASGTSTAHRQARTIRHDPWDLVIGDRGSPSTVVPCLPPWEGWWHAHLNGSGFAFDCITPLMNGWQPTSDWQPKRRQLPAICRRRVPLAGLGPDIQT